MRECGYKIVDGQTVVVCPECDSESFDFLNEYDDHTKLCNECETIFVCP